MKDNFKVINPDPFAKEEKKQGSRGQRAKRVKASRDPNLVVVLENIYDPHNAMASLRCCEAFGVQNVFFVFEKTPEFNPLRIGKKSSSSANKWLTYYLFKSSKDCLSYLKSKDFLNVATVIDEKAIKLWDFKRDFFAKYAFWFGNEKEGLSEFAISNSDVKLYIPMHGFIQSLNLSVSVGIVLFYFRFYKEKFGT